MDRLGMLDCAATGAPMGPGKSAAFKVNRPLDAVKRTTYDASGKVIDSWTAKKVVLLHGNGRRHVRMHLAKVRMGARTYLGCRDTVILSGIHDAGVKERAIAFLFKALA